MILAVTHGIILYFGDHLQHPFRRSASIVLRSNLNCLSYPVFFVTNEYNTTRDPERENFSHYFGFILNSSLNTLVLAVLAQQRQHGTQEPRQ